MQETNEKRRRYRWPWIVWAVFAVFVLLAIVWMSFAVSNVERERNFSAPPTTNSSQWSL
jgi:cytoskeletal protein RodZ